MDAVTMLADALGFDINTAIIIGWMGVLHLRQAVFGVRIGNLERVVYARK